MSNIPKWCRIVPVIIYWDWVMAKERVYIGEEVKAKAVEELKHGKPRKLICEELGVSIHTVNLWMAKDKKARAVKADSQVGGESQEYRQITATKPEVSGDLERRVAELELDVRYLKQKLAFIESK